MRLAGKTAIITGAAGGIGSVACRVFAEEGARVVVTDLDGDGARSVAEQVVSQGGHALAVQADVTLACDVERLVDTTVRAFGPPHIVINNAGVDEPKVSLTELDEADFDRTVAVNLKGTWLVMKHAVPHMIEAGGGSIVNVASIAAEIPCSTVGYTAAKAGVIAMSRNAAVELGAHNIRVNALCPGAVRTPMAHRVANDESVLERLSLLGRIAEPEDVVSMALFLATDESNFATGASFTIDGGWSAMTTFSGVDHRGTRPW